MKDLSRHVNLFITANMPLCWAMRESDNQEHFSMRNEQEQCLILIVDESHGRLACGGIGDACALR